MKEEQLLKDLKMLRAMFNDEVRYKAIDDLIKSAIDSKKGQPYTIKAPGMSEEDQEKKILANIFNRKVPEISDAEIEKMLEKRKGEKTFHDHIQSKGYDMDENGNPIKINYDDKPPIGILPRKIWEDEKEATRHQKLKQAIIRYIEADKPIKQEWIDEYHDWLPKSQRNFMKPGRKRIRAWFAKETFLYEVDELNKKLNIVSSIDIADKTPLQMNDFIKRICQIDDGASEYWFRKEPGASGKEIEKYIDNKLLPNRKCFFFSKRSSNDHHELERAYFKQHGSGKE